MNDETVVDLECVSNEPIHSFLCDFCDQTCSSRKQLAKHLKQHVCLDESCTSCHANSGRSSKQKCGSRHQFIIKPSTSSTVNSEQEIWSASKTFGDLEQTASKHEGNSQLSKFAKVKEAILLSTKPPEKKCPATQGKHITHCSSSEFLETQVLQTCASVEVSSRNKHSEIANGEGRPWDKFDVYSDTPQPFHGICSSSESNGNVLYGTLGVGEINSKETEEPQENKIKIIDLSLKDNACTMRTHTFYCVQCDQAFSRKGNLERHAKKHDGSNSSKSFQCSDCGSIFTSKFNLERHKSLHSPSKLFNCSLCDKKFVNVYYLDAHMSTHSDVRKYYCDLCENLYKTKYGLNKHYIQHQQKVTKRL